MEFIAGSSLPKGGIVEGHLYNGFFYSRFDPVFQNWFGTADFVESDGNSVEDDIVKVDTVRDSLTSPCFVAALNALSLSQVKNYIGDLYNSYFDGFGATINVSIVQSDTMPPSLASQCYTFGSNWTVGLNSADASEAEELTAGYIIHELEHCYTMVYHNLNPTVPGLTTNTGQHEFMLTHFTAAAISLLETQFNMSPTQATTVAIASMGDLWSIPSDSTYIVTTFGVSYLSQDTCWSNYYNGITGTKCP